MKFLRKNYAFLGTFLTFFCLCGFVVTCSFLLFLAGFELPEDQLRRAALSTF